ncbi:MAG: DNA polymerase III subunit gamma/tau [Candidatus Methylomirabilis oxygeniifera]|uniref:DNA polymerase III subunit gamma/tau n=1 Tax=Methylomirabilis oxygeniifera TaxID=671143 RepID=D5MLV8_METO1|nr:MAG: DNA polymerase III subunit gamma/tau [Candidatus Methylomirabilis oxyfera]CBE70015.1 DNA polymerase III, subunits gamma and tau [Candidatus Methylomirabilis oxyfera]
MSYLVLARRWRPQNFDEVVGQRPVTQTLKNAIAKDRVAHALLFAGPRGVGKTTTARILAKALNCERGRTSEPCSECASCNAIATGRSVDCLEIDGASNRGIDEVRELREIVRYAPSRDKCKVIIIDEVHMLTEPAFNALLKTLEEPPPGVIFILATTHAHKIPPTILSRCQRHDFRRLGQTEILPRLQQIACEEGAAVSDGAMKAIARAAEGSLRDAQSLLDQAIAYSGDAVSEEDVAVVLGLVEGELLAQTTQAIIERDSSSALAVVESLSARGDDLQRFCQELLAHLRDLMVSKASKDPAPLLQLSRVPLDTIRAQAAALTLADLETVFQVLSRAEFDMRRASHPRFVLEMALVEATEARSLQTLEALLTRLAALEEKLPAGRVADPKPSALPLLAAVPAVRPVATRQPVEAPPSAPSDSATGPQEGWSRMTRLLEQKKRSLAALLIAAQEVTLEQDRLIVMLGNGNTFTRSTLDDPENRRLVAGAAAEVFGRSLAVEYRFQTSNTVPAGSDSAGLSAGSSTRSTTGGATQRTTGQGELNQSQPSGEVRSRLRDPQQRAVTEQRMAPSDQEALRRHPLVRRAVELFDGQVVRVRAKQPE